MRISMLFVWPFLLGVNAAEPGVDATRGLLERLLPSHADQFILEIMPKDPAGDVFEIESREGKIVLRGNNGVALASALNWYLKYCRNCHLSLKAKQLKLPNVLPALAQKIRRVSPDRWRYFLNYCCFGYSLPWYDWTQWEQLIDWMALNGVNAPLSVTGQEAVWEATGRRLGFNESEIRGFLAGPPYLPFGWMGCLDGWGGPLPASWSQSHAELEKKIVTRERAFGMTPVLQGFTGHVPPATKTRFSQAKLHTVRWAEWTTYMLDPLDPLFNRFGTTFIEEQRRLFGTDHLYAADTFIEMTPPSGDTNFLAGIGRAIYEGMAKADPEAVWVLQGWTFFNQAQFWTQPRVQAFLDAVPNSHMLVLDLFCDATPVWNQTRGFYGKPWVWCALQNFGDCVYLGGSLNRIHADLPAARKHEFGKNLRGIGFVNEGLDYNPVIFDLLFEQTWRAEPVALDSWVKRFSRRVHGASNSDAEEAWTILCDTVYNGLHEFPVAYTLPPSLNLSGTPPYDNQRLVQAWERLLKASARADADAGRFHLVSVARQVLGNYSSELQRDMLVAWRAKDQKVLQTSTTRMLELIRDLDSLLATRPEYLLGCWLEDARRWGATPQEKDRMEWNARRVITMWGETTGIRDYSRREWSGMLTNFYLKRWEQFGQALDAALAKGTDFNGAVFDRSLQQWEREWANNHDSFPVKPTGDTLVIAHQLWNKYRQPLAKSYAPDAVSLTTGKPVSCSSALPGFPATLANDGRAKSTDRYWATDVTKDKDPWWQVDLEKPTRIGRVQVIGFFGDKRYYGFTVEGSKDGQQWETLADRRENKELSTWTGYSVSFAPRDIRYLRIRETYNSANTGRHLVEVMAFER